jgi:hypothetical protein
MRPDVPEGTIVRYRGLLVGTIHGGLFQVITLVEHNLSYVCACNFAATKIKIVYSILTASSQGRSHKTG